MAAILKETWHYNYYLAIRKFWGLENKPDRVSLCPYFQTMVWFTLFAVLFSPLLVTGWIILKLARASYKGLSKLGFTSVIDWLDRIGFGDTLDDSEEELKDKPGLTTFLTAIITIVSLALTGMVLAVVALVLYQFIIHIPTYPALIAWAIVYTGYVIFSITGILGHVLQVLGYATISFFTNGPLWSAIAYYGLIGAAIIGISMLIGLGIYRVSTTATFQKIWSKFLFKMNGFQEARAVAAKRRETESYARQEAEPVKDRYAPDWRDHVRKAIRNTLDAIFSRFLKSKVVAGGESKSVLTTFGVIWEFMWAMKKKVCPVLEFIDRDVLDGAAAVADANKDAVPPTTYNYPEYYVYERMRSTFQEDIRTKNLPTKSRLYNKYLVSTPYNYELPPYLKLIIAKLILDKMAEYDALKEFETIVNTIDDSRRMPAGTV